MDAVISDKRFGVNHYLFVFVDEKRVPAPPVVPELVKFSRESRLRRVLACVLPVEHLTQHGSNEVRHDRHRLALSYRWVLLPAES